MEDEEVVGVTTAVAGQDLAGRLANEHYAVRRAMVVLGEILSEARSTADEEVDAFIKRVLGLMPTALAVESKELPVTFAISVGSALGDLIALHNPELGAGEDCYAPSWAQVDVDGIAHSYPNSLSAFFPAGSLAKVPVVVRLAEHPRRTDRSVIWVYAAKEARLSARELLESIVSAARVEKNFYRGRFLRARSNSGLEFQIISPPVQQRSDLVLPDAVWKELDVNVGAVTTRAGLLRAMGLGTRRGVLIAGPPGVGKSAVCRLIGAELAGDFTVILVDARTASSVLRDVYVETVELGPTIVILEDVDLYIGSRDRGDGGQTLADFLAVMDGTEQYDDVLTLAPTNNPKALDKAATRSARFDSVIHLKFPDRAACVAILKRYLAALPAGDQVDVTAVANQLPSEVSGADLREIVRLSILQHGAELTTQTMRKTISEGRWKPTALVGNYL